MIQEVADLYDLLSKVHGTIDAMVADLSDEQWLKKPLPNWNNIASIIEHVTRVERKFFSAVGGQAEDIDVGAPFRANSWDLNAVRQAWADSLPYAEHVLEPLQAEDLTAPGMNLGVGKLNKRQLIAYAISHTAHHRGQIPLVKKLFG
ncbi:MAG: DinB family protein [Alicyclobacillus herbarius]|uniref:DinB family protein n=1 Tax=Alicyclobacillus herbarius TaxID=122960 RepID=UPI0003F94708|nr:DinB family protein [Alicyclobacillus herbarius]MCL6632372.1 DinB family protein [Alicyclobacillus herbarius]